MNQMIPRSKKDGKYCVVELFAGLGCVAQGFERSGHFDTVLLTDNDPDTRDTYRENFPAGAPYLLRNVEALRAKDILRAADGRPIAGILGCPPCQGFSAAGLRDAEDERNRRLRDYFRLVKSLSPPFLLMENVPRVFQYRLFKEILREIEKRYWIWTGVLNAALFGVPQTRHRAIVIGYRRDLCVAPSAPHPTHLGRRPVFDYSSKRFLSPATRDGSRVLGLCPDVGRADDYWMEHILALTDDTCRTEDLVVVREAIGDLPPASGDDGPLSYQEGASLYAQSLRDSEVRNHRRWGHSNRLLSRLRRIPEGGGLFDSRPCRSRQQPYYSQAYTRLHGDGLARTVTTNFHNPGSGRFLHYADLRAITVREAARLQGIRDDFVFIKSPTTQERLIGNAFPIPLAEALARHIATELTDKL